MSDRIRLSRIGVFAFHGVHDEEQRLGQRFFISLDLMLDLAAAGQLTFEEPDLRRFPALKIAKEALAAGGAAPAVMNAANEVAVAAFLDRKIGFLDIAATVAETLEQVAGERLNLALGGDVLEDARQVDATARRLAGDIVAVQGR